MSQGGYIANTDGSQNLSNGGRKISRTVRTLLVSQVLVAGFESPDGPVIIDDHPANQAVLCVQLSRVEEINNGKRLHVDDTTGSAEVRFPSNLNSPLYETIEEFVDKNMLIYGHFRIFNEKITYEVDRIVTDIPAYQPLYHEIHAAREFYHYSGLVTLEEPLNAGVKTEGSQNPIQEPLFVDDSNQIQVRIVDVVKAKEGNDEGASVESVAHELAIEETRAKQMFDVLVKDGILYEVDGLYRLSELGV